MTRCRTLALEQAREEFLPGRTEVLVERGLGSAHYLGDFLPGTPAEPFGETADGRRPKRFHLAVGQAIPEHRWGKVPGGETRRALERLLGTATGPASVSERELDWVEPFHSAVEREDDAEGVSAALARLDATFVHWDARTLTEAVDPSLDADRTLA